MISWPLASTGESSPCRAARVPSSPFFHLPQKWPSERFAKRIRAAPPPRNPPELLPHPSALAIKLGARRLLRHGASPSSGGMVTPHCCVQQISNAQRRREEKPGNQPLPQGWFWLAALLVASSGCVPMPSSARSGTRAGKERGEAREED